MPLILDNYPFLLMASLAFQAPIGRCGFEFQERWATNPGVLAEMGRPHGILEDEHPMIGFVGLTSQAAEQGGLFS